MICNQTKTKENAIMCPCCGETVIKEEFQICHTCGWEHDLVQLDDPNFTDGPNILSLNQTKEWFALKRKLDPTYTWKAHASEDGNPTIDDLNKLRDIVKKKFK